MANLSKPLNQGFAGASIVANYGPYASVAAAHAALVEDGLNVVGMTVGITGQDNTIVEYWYQGGTAQANLVRKQAVSDVKYVDVASRLPITLTDHNVYVADKLPADSREIEFDENDFLMFASQYEAGHPTTVYAYIKAAGGGSATWAGEYEWDNLPEGMKAAWSTGAAEQIQSDWEQSDNTQKDFIKNKPTIPAAQIQSDWEQSDNTQKDFIKNKPTIPAAQIQSDWEQSDNTQKDFIKNKPDVVVKSQTVGLLKNDGTVDATPKAAASDLTNEIARAQGVEATKANASEVYTRAQGTALEESIDDFKDDVLNDVQASVAAQQQVIDTLNGNHVVHTDDHTQEASPDPTKIYREPEAVVAPAVPSYYIDWMYDDDNSVWKPIGKYTFPGIDTAPTKDSLNLLSSGAVLTHGSALDISMLNADTSGVTPVPATYRDLKAALGTNGANVPVDKRAPGMSVKFIRETPAMWNVVKSSADEIPSGAIQLETDPAISDGQYTAAQLTIEINTVNPIDWASQSLGTTTVLYFGYDAPYDIYTVTFVSSVDNTYKQHRFVGTDIGNATFLDVSNWQQDGDINAVQKKLVTDYYLKIEEYRALPDDFVKLEYITGAESYVKIDTGVQCSGNLEIECIFKDNQRRSYGEFFGVYTSENTNSFRLVYDVENTEGDGGLVNTNTKASGAFHISGLTPNTKHHVILNSQNLVLDGVSTPIGSALKGSEQTGTIKINGINLSQVSSQRIISWWIFIIRDTLTGNTLFDGVPCKRKTDDKVGLYDLVSKQFFGNARQNSANFEPGDKSSESSQQILIDKIDKQPTRNSKNLVESDGVYRTTPTILSSQKNSDLDVADEEGNVIMRLSGGHIKTKNFDSEEDVPELRIDNNDFADLDVADEEGNIILRVNGGHIKTKNFDSREINKADSNSLNIDMGLPTDVPKIYIESALLTPNATNNTISPLVVYGPGRTGNPVGSTDTDDVILRFVSNSINFTDNIEINYQGQYTLLDAKKNFSIDMGNKHKFGKWMEFDSFHLKAFYEDFINCRDWVCNRLMEQIYMSRNVADRKPFLQYNDFNDDERSFFASNAFCHVDGFPCEVYVNDVYWGLYIWRLKKHRNNYKFNKDDTNHVFLDPSDFFNNDGTFKWTGLEIRNPKKDSGNPDGFEENVEPNAGPVKTIIETWRDFMWGITVDTPKEDIEQHMDMKEFIDVYLLLEVCNCWDSWSRNTLYGTWDGQHFAPMPYDMNNGFNGFGGKDSGIYQPYYPPTSNTYNEKARRMPWFGILENLYSTDIRERYLYLSRIGIFTTENIFGLFEKFTIWAGNDAYDREAKRWPSIPSLIGDNRDIDKLSIIYDWISMRVSYINSKYNF